MEKDAPQQTGGALGLFVKRCILGTKEAWGFSGKPVRISVGKTCGGRHISRHHQFKGQGAHVQKEKIAAP